MDKLDFKSPDIRCLTPTMAAIAITGTQAASVISPLNDHFKFPPDPKLLHSGDMDRSRYKNLSNKRRSFTPLKTYIKSPGLSPIESIYKSGTVFRLPPNKVDKVPADSTVDEMNGSSFLLTHSPSPRKYTETPILDRSSRSGFLNHKISVDRILETQRLQKYISMFDKEEIDYEVFLSLSDRDLRRLGVSNSPDRCKLLNIIRELQA